MTSYEFYKNGIYLFNKYMDKPAKEDFIDMMDAFFIYGDLQTGYLIYLISSLKTEINLALLAATDCELRERIRLDLTLLEEMKESDVYKELEENDFTL